MQRFILATGLIIGITLTVGEAGASKGGSKPASTATKTVEVKGYVTKNGTYVAPHYRAAPRTDARIEPRTEARAPTIVVPEDRGRTAPRSTNHPPPHPGNTLQPVGATGSGEMDDETRARILLELADQMMDESRAALKADDRPESVRIRDKAKSRYEEIISRYPITRAGKTAAERITILK